MQHQSAEFFVSFSVAENSVRRTACISGYRPNHKHPLTGEYFMGELCFDGAVLPGETTSATARIWCTAEQLESLLQKKTWTIWEGPHYVGHIDIIAMGESSGVIKS